MNAIPQTMKEDALKSSTAAEVEDEAEGAAELLVAEAACVI